ncbi:hypothetical protein N481_14745 [Pseudoalteromonas luteoviolacea S4047-1]|uniref:Uncharacterized protein n=1 Tax=Pseudoalteromonas luteoviolacea S4054 TaxID=1129367 RepID=A0A0F6AF79_9GAMM|nr:hypothetical protein N479_07155 [Pseudoalteromonas luteoviolacea S4054]KZN72484.1 hypothetical protein N481_14745 [Pseudoalteromonas luteoviolacea S4047-1]
MTPLNSASLKKVIGGSMWKPNHPHVIKVIKK